MKFSFSIIGLALALGSVVAPSAWADNSSTDPNVGEKTRCDRCEAIAAANGDKSEGIGNTQKSPEAPGSTKSETIQDGNK